ncbi:MAG: class I tRNA ligase family protein, partial [bacterium]|nr:class I tRNA ligase family protein [bacterium]
DALIYYITGLGYKSENDELFNKYWPADLQVIGKGITRFHAVYWPAMLLSAGLPLPKAEFVHGYVTIEGQKISKSLGNVIDPFDLVKRHGTDPIRYYLLREIPSYGDGDFSEKRFNELYNADLANGLGNLLARVTALAEKYCDGKVPETDKDPDSHPLRADKTIYNWKKAWQGFDEAMGHYKFNEALASTWRFIGEADKYVNDNKPWELAEKDKNEFNWVLYGLLDGLCQIAWQVYPFLPETSKEIGRRLNMERLLAANPQIKDSWTNIKPGTKIISGSPLFPRKTK